MVSSCDCVFCCWNVVWAECLEKMWEKYAGLLDTCMIGKVQLFLFLQIHVWQDWTMVPSSGSGYVKKAARPLRAVALNTNFPCENCGILQNMESICLPSTANITRTKSFEFNFKIKMLRAFFLFVSHIHGQKESRGAFHWKDILS